MLLLTDNDLRQLEYLDCVIKETLRLRAPAAIGREVASTSREDDEVVSVTNRHGDSYILPKGAAIYIIPMIIQQQDLQEEKQEDDDGDDEDETRRKQQLPLTEFIPERFMCTTEGDQGVTMSTESINNEEEEKKESSSSSTSLSSSSERRSRRRRSSSATATTASTSIESPYLPFSIGPRNCIGQYIAMAEMRSVISQIVLHYKLEVPSNGAVEPCPYLTLTVNPHEAQIQLSKR